MASLNCPMPDENTLRDLNMDPAEAPDINARLEVLNQILKAGHSGSSMARNVQGNVIRGAIIDNMQRVSGLVRSVQLSPQRGKGLQAILARDAAIVHNFGGLGKGYSEAGWVRSSLNQIQQLYRGEFNKSLRLAAVSDNVADAMASLKKILRKYSIRGADVDYIATQAHDLAWFPHIAQSTYQGQLGQQALELKIRRFVDELQSRFHLSQQDAANVMRQGERVVDAYLNVGKIAESFNMNVRNTDVMGIIPRLLSDEAKMRFDWKIEDLTKGSIQYNNGAKSDVMHAALISRMSNDFQVEDEVVLDYILRSISLRDYHDPLQLYRAAGADSISGLLNDSGKLTQAFLDVLQRSPETIEALVDNAIVSKIPLTAPELVERLRDVFQFPFKNLNEVFAVDWNEGMRIYRRQLDKIAEESGYVHLIVKNAIDGNWGITTAEKLAEADKYRDFVPLMGRGAGVPGAIPEEYFSRFNMGKGVVREMSALPDPYHKLAMLENVWVHPTVADMIGATLELQTSPHSLGIFARVIKELTTRFRSLALATVEYIPRQIWNGFVALAAGGGDILAMPTYLTKILLSQLSGKDMSHFLDNKKIIGKLADGTDVTELDVWHRAQELGFISEFEPMTGDRVNPNGYHPWKGPASAIRSYAATMQLGIGRVAEQALGDVGSMIDKATYPIRWSNNWVDNAGRFSGLISSIKDYTPYTPSHFIRDVRRSITRGSAQTFPNVEAAVEHWKGYFYDYTDRSVHDRRLSSYLIPFWSFHSKNIPAVVRHVIHHPTRYVAFQRLHAVANSPVANDDRLNEGTVQPWLWHTAPIFFRIPGGRHDGRDAFYAVPTTSLDPYATVVESAKDAGKAVLKMFGVRTKAPTQERLEGLPWSDSTTNNLLARLLENTYPLYQAAIQTATNRDEFGNILDRQDKEHSFLGYSMPRWASTMLNALLPITGTINRYNPRNAFGTPTVYDPYTGQYTRGEGSRMPFSGAAPRTDKDSFNVDNPYRWLQFTGVKVYPVDIALNAGMTHDQISIMIAEGKKHVQRSKRELLKMEEGAARTRREDQIAEAQWLIEQLQYDLRNFRAWAYSHGFNVQKAQTVLKQRNLRIGDLPDYTGSEQQHGQWHPPSESTPEERPQDAQSEIIPDGTLNIGPQLYPE